MREQWKQKWIEAVLLQMGSRSPEAACEDFRASVSTLRRWTQGDFKKEPGSSYRERLAELRGQDFKDFERWLNGESYSPREGKTWAELGREAISDPAALQEFLQDLDKMELNQLLHAVIHRQGQLLAED